MLRQPTGTLQGVALKWYRPGQIYDLPAPLGSYLVAEGFAIVEMRAESNLRISVEHDRRRRSPV
jgi:hypothetical protein